MTDKNSESDAVESDSDIPKEPRDPAATVIDSSAIGTNNVVDDSTGGPQQPPSATDDTSVRVGRYRLVGELGQGGFGHVYLGHDDTLNRPVAVKMLKRTATGRSDANRESSVLASLRHPGIAEVYDVGQDADGHDYIVTRFVDGQPLTRVLASGPIEPLQAARWASQIASALQHAHSQGITHRDIKPSNLMIAGDGNAVVLDFGVALLDSDLRSTVDYSGTPAWMSPEQAAGRGAEVDGRSDVFSLGCVLYEMLTGVRAFRGASNVETLALIQTSQPRPLRQIRSDIPAVLESICLRCLEKQSEARYATAADLDSALIAAVKQLATSSFRERLTPAKALLGTVAAVAVAVVLWVVTHPGDPPETSTPQQPDAVATDTAALAEMKLILERMEAAESRSNAGLPSEDDEEEAGPDEPDSSGQSVPVLPAGYADLETQLKEAIDQDDKDKESSVLLRAFNQLMEDRHNAIAEQVARRMVAISEDEPEGASYPIACGQLGLVLYKRDKFDEAIKNLMVSIGLYQRLYDKIGTRGGSDAAQYQSQMARMLGISWMRIGNAHKFAEEWDDAGVAYRTAMRLYEKHDRDSEMLTLLLNYGSMESQQGNHLTATALLTQGVDVAVRLKDEDARAQMLLNLANAKSRGGDDAAAIKLYDQVDVLSADLDDYDLRSKLLLNYAESLLEQRKTNEAREKLVELKRILRPGDADAEEALRLLPLLEGTAE
jgi:serine/threonine protein kinase